MEIEKRNRLQALALKELAKKKSKKHRRETSRPQRLQVFSDGNAVKLAQRLYFNYVSDTDMAGFLQFLSALDYLMVSERKVCKNPINLNPEEEAEEENDPASRAARYRNENDDDEEGIDVRSPKSAQKMLERMVRATLSYDYQPPEDEKPVAKILKDKLRMVKLENAPLKPSLINILTELGITIKAASVPGRSHKVLALNFYPAFFPLHYSAIKEDRFLQVLKAAVRGEGGRLYYYGQNGIAAKLPGYTVFFGDSVARQDDIGQNFRMVSVIQNDDDYAARMLSSQRKYITNGMYLVSSKDYFRLKPKDIMVDDIHIPDDYYGSPNATPEDEPDPDYYSEIENELFDGEQLEGAGFRELSRSKTRAIKNRYMKGFADSLKSDDAFKLEKNDGDMLILTHGFPSISHRNAYKGMAAIVKRYSKSLVKIAGDRESMVFITRGAKLLVKNVGKGKISVEKI